MHFSPFLPHITTLVMDIHKWQHKFLFEF